jgi:hypothetical protein
MLPPAVLDAGHVTKKTMNPDIFARCQRLYILAFTWLSLTVGFTAHAADEMVSPTRLNDILHAKLQEYRRVYPEINFLHLRGGEDTIEDMVRLGGALGNTPVNRDYEHPPELREELLNVSLNRILTLMQARMPSSSLYQVDKENDDRHYLCVLSLYPEEIAGSSLIATRHLLDQTEEFINRIPRSMWMPAEDYLEFAIDHELYHCLYSRYIEPQPMSQLEFWGDYIQFLNEHGADAYALARHIRKQGSGTQLAEVLPLIRGAALSSADFNHRTCGALDKVKKIQAEEIKFMSEQDLFALANDIRGQILPAYEDYLVYLASAIQAMDRIGTGHFIEDQLRIVLDDVEADPAQVSGLIDHNNYCLGKLSGGSTGY